MSERIYWIDIVKGLLILLMVLGHIPNITGSLGVENSLLLKCMFFSSAYTCFFMQAFIILTGYTSNFDKEIRVYLISLFKTIVIPWFSFSFICKIVLYFSFQESLLYNIDGNSYFFLFEDYWFLHVLFFGKIIYYFIYKYIKSDIKRGFLLLVLIILAFFILSENLYHQHNYLHYKDTMCMTFYLWVGDYCKRHDVFELLRGKTLVVIVICYAIGHALRLFFKLNGSECVLVTPVIISHAANITSILQVPIYLFYVMIGSFSCFGLIKMLKRNRVLEYFGRNSLIIYCIHFLFLKLLVIPISTLIYPKTIFTSFIYILLIFVVCILNSICIIELIKYKPFNYLIGKF